MYQWTGRSGWGARYRPDRHIPITSRTELFVHHTVVGPMDHSECDDYLRRIERQHHDQWNFSVGYNDLFCSHLVLYEGCGRDARGQHCPRHNTYGLGLAFMLDGRNPLPAGIGEAIRWYWDLSSNSAGRRLVLFGHRDKRATACPGNRLYDIVVGLRNGNNFWTPSEREEPVSEQGRSDDNPILTKGSSGHYVAVLQGLLFAHAKDLVISTTKHLQINREDFIDGAFGDATDYVLREWQKRTTVLVPDGVAGPKTWSWLCG